MTKPESESRRKAREVVADPEHAGLSTRELMRRTGLSWHVLDLARREAGYAQAAPAAPERPPTTTVEIARLRRDLGTQMRPETPAATAEHYKECMERGDEFPPVDATETDDGTLILIDGFIRVAASELLGRSEIEAVVTPGTARDALWRALAANSIHGLNRDPRTIRNAVRTALADPEWGLQPTNVIARHLGVSWSTVKSEQQRIEAEVIRAQAAVVHEIGDDSVVPDREPGADDDPEREEVERAPALARDQARTEEGEAPASEPAPAPKKEKKLTPAQRQRAEHLEKIRALPLWLKLPESRRPLFEADALHFLYLLPGRDELSVLHRTHRVRPEPGKPEPIYDRIVQRFLHTKSYHPREWKLCLGPEGSGCDGSLKCGCKGRMYVN